VGKPPRTNEGTTTITMSIRDRVETATKQWTSMLTIAAIGVVGLAMNSQALFPDALHAAEPTAPDAHVLTITPPTVDDVPQRFQKRCVANEDWASDAYPRRGVVSPKGDPTNFKTVSFDRAMRMAEKQTHWWVMSCP